MIDKSDCSRNFSKKITKKHPDTHKKIRNCNDFENSLNFAKVSLYFYLAPLWLHQLPRLLSILLLTHPVPQHLQSQKSLLPS